MLPDTDCLADATPRHNWTLAETLALFELPFATLMLRAQQVHQRNFPDGGVQISSLLSIKTGGCPEDCAYCPQSVRHRTGMPAGRLLPVEAVIDAARQAQAAGATRFCMGAAWRSPKGPDLEQVLRMVEGVKALGMETCATLGMLDAGQANRLRAAGLDYYNHNLDTSPEHYDQIITTRRYEDRLDTLQHVHEAGIHLCVGGIVGMGESLRDRASLLMTLANLPAQPDSVPINRLVRVPGTPLAEVEPLDDLDFVRVMAVARLLLPRSRLRLSAGRDDMNDATQALCFLAGANSIFYGDRLLTTANPPAERDLALLARLGLHAEIAGEAALAAIPSDAPAHCPHRQPAIADV